MATPVQPTSQNTHISSNFGKLLEPGLRTIFFETYNELPEQYSKVLNINKSTKAKETDWGMGAFGDWTVRETNLSPVSYKTLSPGLERTYTHSAFTQGFMIERELYDDEQYRQINKFPKAMGRSGRAKIEKDAITVLTGAFANDIYDGKKLCANDHPLLDSTKTSDNLITGSLTQANLKIALQCMAETLDEAGNLISLPAKKLVVPRALEFTAREIVQSILKPGTIVNDLNVLKGALEVVSLDYLGLAGGGSDTAWYILSDNHELNFFWRIRPEFKWDEDFDTFVAKYRGYMRYSYGVSDWRGIVGSEGTVG